VRLENEVKRGGRMAGVDVDLAQWPSQEPIHWRYLQYIFLAYFSGLCKGIYPQTMALYGTNVPPF